MAKRIELSHKKKNMELLIDGENLSSDKAEAIIKAAKSQGELFEGKVYGRQCDRCTKNWSKKANEVGVSDIRLFGKPTKNKIDNKIKKDARKVSVQYKNIDVICVASNDGGYADIIMELRSQGKRVVVIGTDNAAKSLRESCSKFIKV